MSETMKTPWDDPAFVSAWNETYGMDMRNAIMRPGLIYPWIAENIGDFNDKKLIDIGCGNGNLIRHFLTTNFHEWHGVDTGSEIIKSAEAEIVDSRVYFTYMDPSQPFPYPETGLDFDIVASVFVVEEISNDRYASFCKNIAALLKEKGKALIFTNHPINVMREDMLRASNPAHPVKFEGLCGYFDGNPSKYSLSLLNQEKKVETKVAYHHKTLAEIMNGFASAGLKFETMLEVPNGVFKMSDLQIKLPKVEDAPRFLGLTFQKG